MINPIHTIFGEINPEHYHIDFVYYATAESFDTTPEDGKKMLLYLRTIKQLDLYV